MNELPDIQVFRSYGICYRIVCQTKYCPEMDQLFEANGFRFIRSEEDIFSDDVIYWVLYVDDYTLDQLQQLADHDSYDEVLYKYNNGLISAIVYEAYCHLWRTESFRFSNWLQEYENFDYLPFDTQELIKTFKEKELVHG